MKALVLSGGGSNGGFEVGAALRLAELGLEYDAYVGVSTGALNAACFAQFRTLAEGVAAMREIYAGVRSNADIYVGEPLARILGGANSLYDATPLERLVRRKLDPAKVASSGKRLAVGAVQIGYGGGEAYRTFVDPRGELLIRAVLASAAYPVAFQPVQIAETYPKPKATGWRDPWYADGGLRRPVPILDAIELGATEIDVLATSPAERRSKPMNPETAGVPEIALGAVSILAHEVEWQSLIDQAPGVTIRIVRPSRDLGDSLAFGRDKRDPSPEEIFRLGYEDARAQVG